MRICALWAVMALVLGTACVATAADKDGEGWVTIFDGKSLDGWKINELPESWKLTDGMLVANGKRSHIFYVGDEKPFVNFEFKAGKFTQADYDGMRIGMEAEAARILAEIEKLESVPA